MSLLAAALAASAIATPRAGTRALAARPAREVGMAGRVFSPEHLTVLVGEAL
jgi:hypothetical protein